MTSSNDTLEYRQKMGAFGQSVPAYLQTKQILQIYISYTINSVLCHNANSTLQKVPSDVILIP